MPRQLADLATSTAAKWGAELSIRLTYGIRSCSEITQGIVSTKKNRAGRCLATVADTGK